MTIAGSDSGGGAGIQADLKTFSAFGGYGMSVLTAVTAQNTCAVTAVHEIPPEVVAAQIDAVFEDIGVDVLKIGMLSSAAIIEAVAQALRRHGVEGRHGGPPLVLDPVMIAKSGDALLADSAVEALTDELLPLATVLTPNLPEAERLTGETLMGSTIDTGAQRRRAAEQLQEKGRGAAVLIKGGHDTEAAGGEVTDLLFDGAEVRRFVHPRLETTSTHGTGCTLSAAIAAGLGAGAGLAESVSKGVDYLHGAIAAAFPLGSGHGPVDHLYRSHP